MHDIVLTPARRPTPPGVPVALSAVTLIALGSQVPDILSGYWMAKDGMQNGSLSGNVGSQVQ